MESGNPGNGKKNPTIQHTVFGFNLMIEPINKINCNLEFVNIVILKTSMYLSLQWSILLCNTYILKYI